MMSLTEETGRYISLMSAQETVGAWVNSEKDKSQAIDTTNPKAHAFGREKILEVLDQIDCVGLKIYHGMEDGKKTLVLVGVNDDGDDIVSGLKIDKAIACPIEGPSSLTIY